MNPENPESNSVNSEEVPKADFDYNLDNLDNDLVLKYQPTFLAKGGEHLVYEIPDHPDVIAKVRIGEIKRMLEINYQAGQPLDSLSPEAQSKAQDYLETERSRYQTIRQHFGSEHVPNQKEFLIKVPITEDIIRSFYDGQLPANTDEVWSIMMIQKRIKELDIPHLSMVSGYSEHSETLPETYNQTTQHLIQEKNSEQPLSSEDFLAIQSNEHLRTLVEQSETDENLKETLADLVEKIISYTSETGEILDLAGEDNVILHQKDDVWSYTLVDARYPGTSNMIETVEIILSKLSTGDGLDEHEKNILLNTVNFVRTINGLAEQIGVSNKIDIIPDGLQDLDLDFLKLLR